MTDVWLPLLGGLALLVAGGELLVRGYGVRGAVRVAAALDFSPLVIGLTPVGFGISTPELVTSAQAALVDAPGIAQGNVVGSNVHDIMGIGGVAALIAPGPAPPEIVGFDNLVRIAASPALVGLARSGLRLSRPEGAALLASHAACVWWLWP